MRIMKTEMGIWFQVTGETLLLKDSEIYAELEAIPIHKVQHNYYRNTMKNYFIYLLKEQALAEKSCLQ